MNIFVGKNIQWYEQKYKGLIIKLEKK